MIKSIFTALTFVAYTSISAQTLILDEDFTTGIPLNFTVSILDTNICDASVSAFSPGWISLADVLAPANMVVGASSFFNPTGTANRWLISSQLTLGAFGNSLTWKARSHDASFPDGYRVLISNTGTNPEDFTDTLLTVATELDVWTTHTINLSTEGYNSDLVYIAFALQSTDKYILYLDDVQVEKDNSASVFEDKLVDLAIYPNPTSGIIQVNTSEEISGISLIQLNGIEIPLRFIDGVITIENYDSGYYYLQVKTITGKIIRERILKI